MTAVKLGILDWGIGGVGCLSLVRTRFPAVPLVYWSDSGFTPYGIVEPEVLAARIHTIRRSLVDRHGVTYLIVACNAASTVLDRLPDGIPTLGVIAPGLRAVLENTPKSAHIGVVGGQRTIESDAWGGPLRAAGRRVTQAIAQPISAHVEAGRLQGRALDEDLGHILEPLQVAGIDQLILACTHYPAAQPAFEAYFSAVTMINPISATVDVAAKYGRLHRGAGGGLTALTTGSPLTLQTNALRAFGVYFPSVDPAPQLD